ncbi:ParA family protein [Luteimonas sp. MHLX1A]|uniref:ParA family protein n=1 Tax=Alterluteimonas muca TaxID=2878684 RepID=UPI001E32F625|nr:ParA family protein [Luteimonas sp. MHLX1A]MCD9046745.1 ParA family protein [Luteimonas sp. MHLX1A]
MQIITVAQNKGGSGKSTVSKLVSTGLAKRGKRVLVLDLDSQCNLSSRFIQMDISNSAHRSKVPPLHPEVDEILLEDPEWSGRSSTADFFYGRVMYPYGTTVENLDLLPGSGDELPQVELVRSTEVVSKVHEQLRVGLRNEAFAEAYDVIVIDTDPSKGPLPTSALRAATHLIIPTGVDPMELEGLHGMLSMWKAENNRRSADDVLELIGILPNKIRNSVSTQKAALEDLQRGSLTGPLMFPGKLSLRSAFSDSDHEAIRFASVLDLPASDPARQEAQSVVDHVVMKLEGSRHV